MSRTKIRVWVTARNVVNTDELRTKLKVASDRAVYQKGKQWILRNAYNYLVNDYTSQLWVEQVKNISDLKAVFGSIGKIPKWALAALEKNEELYRVAPSRSFWTLALPHIVDYLNTQDRDWSRISFPQMEKLVSDWDEELKRQKQGKVNKDDYKHLFNSGQYQWVEILTPEGLKDEGSKMGHCVGGGGYCLNLQKGKIKLFSLRDKNFDNPHVTIEVEKNKYINQIQGKQNKPQPKYADNVADFLNKTKCVPNNEHDLRLLFDWELVPHNGKFSKIENLPKSISLDYTGSIKFISIEGGISPKILQGRAISCPKADHVYVKDVDLEKAISLLAAKARLVVFLTKAEGVNLTKCIDNVKCPELSLRPLDTNLTVRLPEDLARFNEIELLDCFRAGATWVIPENFKAKKVYTNNTQVRRDLKELGITTAM